MKVITAHNVNDAYDQGVRMFQDALADNELDIEQSRAGPVYAWPVPVTTCYLHPTQRILWDGKRDANPFFHFFESLWMLAGRNDVAYITQYNTKMGSFSDDGTTYHGAYGYRWREAFAVDQLAMVAQHLRANPTSRRAVMQIWDAVLDLNIDGKDLPCNCTVKFEVRNGNLRMIVFNRSNDMLFGAYGANAVHFSIMHEWMAAQIGVGMGEYYQVSSNMHVYKNVWEEKVGLLHEDDPYLYGAAVPVPLFTPGEGELEMHEIEAWVDGDRRCPYRCPAIQRVAKPLDTIWQFWKAKDRTHALDVVNAAILADPYNDWLHAAHRWMHRRMVK